MQQISNFEKQAAIYRHDMRHHLNFISQCIRENQNSEALKYISEICTSLDNSKIVKYCTNEALNLIFSYYADEAKENDIKVDISVTAYDFSLNCTKKTVSYASTCPTAITRHLFLKMIFQPHQQTDMA